MISTHPPSRRWLEPVVLACLFVALGGLIMVVFSPLRPLLEDVPDYLGRIALCVGLLALLCVSRKNARLRPFSDLLTGLLILAVTVSLDWIFSIFLLKNLGVDGNTPAGYALLKLNECAVVVGSVVLFTRFSGAGLGSIYLQRGRLKLGLAVGLVAFFLAAAGSTFMADFLFKARDLTFARILAWLPWLLLFVLANAAQEEILFRGLFLRKLQPFFGAFLSNALVALVFTALHQGASYSSSDWIFLAALVPLALAWGYLTQKTDAVWGSILFHAGMDIPIMLGIFSNLA